MTLDAELAVCRRMGAVLFMTMVVYAVTMRPVGVFTMGGSRIVLHHGGNIRGVAGEMAMRDRHGDERHEYREAYRLPPRL